MNMEKRDRVMAAIKGEKVDRLPVGFWMHFRPEFHHGEKSVAEHLRFLQGTGVDILKIMNENECPCKYPIQTAGDWDHVSADSLCDESMRDQLEIVKRVTDATKQEAFVIATVHGLISAAHHAMGRPEIYDDISYLLPQHLHENPKGFSKALDEITDYLITLAQGCVKEGVDGIFYAAFGAEKGLFTKEEFDEYIRPRDLKILQAIKDAGAVSVLHICRRNLDMERYGGYRADIVNWGEYAGNLSLEEGKKLFPGCTILGGFDDRDGPLVNGSREEIAAWTESVVTRMGREKFIMGADCTLPTDLPLEHIRYVVEACEKIGG